MVDNDKIRRWAVGHTPAQVIRTVKSIYWRLLAQPEVTVVPLEEEYGSIERHNWVDAQLIPIQGPLPSPMATFAPTLQDGRYKIPEDYVTVLKDVLYCPVNNVVMTEPGRIIAESLCAAINVKPFPRRIVSVDGYCTAWRTPKNNYYHTLIDNLPRLISIGDFTPHDSTSLQLIFGGELSQAESFYISEFCPPHVHLTPLATDYLYHIENLVVTPFKTRRYAGYLPHRYATHIRSRLLPNRPSMRKHRLFISRVNTTRRHIENLTELGAALAERGFQTIALEELPLTSQIELFYDAEIVVAAHGAGLANILFGDDLHVVELFPSSYVVPHYFYLSQSLGHRYSYWCGREASHHNDFKVDVDDILAVLDEAGVKQRREAAVPFITTPSQNQKSQTG